MGVARSGQWEERVRATGARHSVGCERTRGRRWRKGRPGPGGWGAKGDWARKTPRPPVVLSRRRRAAHLEMLAVFAAEALPELLKLLVKQHLCSGKHDKRQHRDGIARSPGLAPSSAPTIRSKRCVSASSLLPSSTKLMSSSSPSTCDAQKALRLNPLCKASLRVHADSPPARRRTSQRRLRACLRRLRLLTKVRVLARKNELSSTSPYPWLASTDGALQLEIPLCANGTSSNAGRAIGGGQSPRERDVQTCGENFFVGPLFQQRYVVLKLVTVLQT